MAEKYSVVRTDNMMGTNVGSYLDSVRFYEVQTVDSKSVDVEKEIENGNVVAVGDLLEGERELHRAVAPAANTDLKKIGLVATPEVLYDERKHSLEEFINPKGSNVRIYYLHSGDEFGVTAEGLNIAAGYTVKVGDAVELMAGTKLKVVATATSGSTQVGKIIAIEKAGRYTYYVVRVA